MGKLLFLFVTLGMPFLLHAQELPPLGNNNERALLGMNPLEFDSWEEVRTAKWDESILMYAVRDQDGELLLEVVIDGPLPFQNATLRDFRITFRSKNGSKSGLVNTIRKFFRKLLQQVE